MKTPLDYGIRLNGWREGQYEAIQAIGESDKELIVASAPTGLGKSAVGIALSEELDYPIRIITKTRSLQDQYAEKRYGGKTLYGLAAYDCALIPGLRASDCVYPHNMKDCPRAGSCGYLREKDAMLAHPRQVISYAYWFVADYLKKKDEYGANLYFDECHELPDTTMDFLEKKFDRAWEKKAKFRIPSLPITQNQNILKKKISFWLNEIATSFTEEAEYLKGRAENDQGVMKRYMFVTRELGQINAIRYQLENHPDEMIIIRDEDGILTAPLSARMFNGFLSSHLYEKAIFTSATVGRATVLMGGLGFKADSFDFIDVPSRFPPSSMPVYIPPDAPRINHRSGDAAYAKQADIITKIVKGSPSEWSGFIHTASTKHAYALANRLKQKGLGDRVWVTPRGSSNEKIQAWIMRKNSHPNTVVVSWDMWTGIDGVDEEINIVAKVPFGTLDTLGMARMERDKTFYRWRTASKMEQAWGRNRRGDPSHYEVEGEPARRICAVIDSNIWKVYNELGTLAKQRIVRSNVEL